MKSRQAILVRPGRFELRDTVLHAAASEMIVRVNACGLCNWELNHFNGTIDGCPQTLGHEVVGTVEQIGESVSRFKIGDRVTGLPPRLSGFADYCILTEKDSVHVDSAADWQVCLGEPLSCVVTTLLAAEPEVGDIGLIFGCGPMGLWCTQVLSGSSLGGLVAVDVHPKRLEMATRFGATCVINPAEEDAVAKFAELTDGHLADFVIEGTGNPAAMSTAAAYLRQTGRGRLIMMSSHEQAGPAFDWRPLQNKGAIVKSTFPVSALSVTDSLRRAAMLYNRGSLQVRPLITHQFKLEEVQHAFETLHSKPKDYIKGIVVPGSV
jgi:threonine dehydrogenase-like Zn-dependent dehydrogenase